MKIYGKNEINEDVKWFNLNLTDDGFRIFKQRI